jgi:hypothetical protein
VNTLQIRRNGGAPEVVTFPNRNDVTMDEIVDCIKAQSSFKNSRVVSPEEAAERNRQLRALMLADAVPGSYDSEADTVWIPFPYFDPDEVSGVTNDGMPYRVMKLPEKNPLGFVEVWS